MFDTHSKKNSGAELGNQSDSIDARTETDALTHSPTIGEIADHLNISEECIIESMEISHAHYPTSLSMEYTNETSNSVS